MQKKSLLALLLVLAIMLSGCALVRVNEEKDRALTIVDVNGETIDKQTIQNYAYYLVNSNETLFYYYYYYGMIDDAYLYELAANQYVQRLVMKQQAVKQGLDQLTAEEQAEVDEQALTKYNSFLDEIAEYYLADSDLTGDALREAAAQYVADNRLSALTGQSTLEDFQKAAKEDKMIDKLKKATVTDEQVQAELDAANFRVVKHILIKYSDAGSVAAAEAALASAQETAAAAKAALESAEEGADLEALQSALTNANNDVTSAESALDEAKQIKAKAEEVYALATAEGADFDALIAEYGEDGGMTTYPDGYAIGEGHGNFVTEFADAAMALEKVGDISEITETDYGYHIILFADDASSQCDSMNEERDEIRDEKMEGPYEEWEKAAKVTTYLDRMN